MTRVRITIETIDAPSDLPSIKQEKIVDVTPMGENNFWQHLEHKVSFSAFEFWKVFKFRFARELRK